MYRGGEPIEGAANILRWLREKEQRYLFLTNGGGASDDKTKGLNLGQKLGIEKDEDVIGARVAQSHSPLALVPPQIKENDTVLVTGHHPEDARRVAKS